MTDQARTVKQQFHDAAHQHSELWQQVQGLERKIKRMEKMIMSTQADADAIAAELQQENSDLNSAVAGIQAEIDALKTAQPSVDLSNLQAQADAVKSAVAAAAALVPAPASPPADGSGSGSPVPSA